MTSTNSTTSEKRAADEWRERVLFLDHRDFEDCFVHVAWNSATFKLARVVLGTSTISRNHPISRAVRGTDEDLEVEGETADGSKLHPFLLASKSEEEDIPVVSYYTRAGTLGVVSIWNPEVSPEFAYASFLGCEGCESSKKVSESSLKELFGFYALSLALGLVEYCEAVMEVVEKCDVDSALLFQMGISAVKVLGETCLASILNCLPEEEDSSDSTQEAQEAPPPEKFLVEALLSPRDFLDPDAEVRLKALILNELGPVMSEISFGKHVRSLAFICFRKAVLRRQAMFPGIGKMDRLRLAPFSSAARRSFKMSVAEAIPFDFAIVLKEKNKEYVPGQQEQPGQESPPEWLQDEIKCHFVSVITLWNYFHLLVQQTKFGDITFDWSRRTLEIKVGSELPRLLVEFLVHHNSLDLRDLVELLSSGMAYENKHWHKQVLKSIESLTRSMSRHQLEYEFGLFGASEAIMELFRRYDVIWGQLCNAVNLDLADVQGIMMSSHRHAALEASVERLGTRVDEVVTTVDEMKVELGGLTESIRDLILRLDLPKLPTTSDEK